MSLPRPPVQNQQEVFAFLRDSRTHALQVPVKSIETHGAVVFLAGGDVYKVKRAVRFPFMDFSTLEKRRVACESEIAVNRQNAPDIYLGVVPITREAGGLRIGGVGEIVEWAVHMRRFDENATFDRLASCGSLDRPLIEKLAAAVADSHERATVADGEPATRAFHRLQKETADELAARPDLFPPQKVAAYAELLERHFAELEPLLLRRGASGRVRRCHGDLHLGNIALIGGDPVLFDAIEFDETIATSDVLYDLSFLLMDLCHRGLLPEANRLLNHYSTRCEERRLDLQGVAALPLFMSLRAAIRAKVIAARADLASVPAKDGALARAYFNTALALLKAAPPLLLAIGGLSGSGKSTVAAGLAPFVGRAPGALHVRSDIERKLLFNAPETRRLPAEAYAPAPTADVYRVLRELARVALDAGQAVVLDATYQLPAERDAIEAVAAEAGVPFVGIWLEAPLELLKTRVAQRQHDASDATAAVVSAQAHESVGAIRWKALDASRDLEAIRADILALVNRPGGETLGVAGAAAV